MRVIFGGNSDIGKAIEGEHISRKDCDVTKFNDVLHIIQTYRPNEIVDCAGVIYPSSIYSSDVLSWEHELKVNLIGSYYIAKLGTLNINAKIVFIGSTSGLRGRGDWSGYCASKAGLISLVQSMAEEGYNAWVVNPSRTATKMRKKLFPDEDQNTLLQPSDIAKVVQGCFDGVYKSGSSITVKKDKIIVEE